MFAGLSQSPIMWLASQPFAAISVAIATASPMPACGLLHPPWVGWYRASFVLPPILMSCHLLISYVAAAASA